jgi:hypothetical protein
MVNTNIYSELDNGLSVASFVRARPAIGRQAAQPRRGPVDRGERGEAATIYVPLETLN